MMSGLVCPYCRTSIAAAEGNQLLCRGCGTPHHSECFEENGGCTVFGCAAAPPSEPKLSIGNGDLVSPEGAHAQLPASPLIGPAPPPPPLPTATVHAPSAPLFSSAGYNVAAPVIYQSRPVPLTQAPTTDGRVSTRNRMTFILFGVLLGVLGVHSFYAGSTKKGFVQLGITVLSFGFAGLMVWIWAIIDICTITNDNEGLPFRD
jgi:hypothetical protein